MSGEADAAEAGRRARWERVDAVLDAALDLGAGERGAFLDGACGSDAALRAEVEQLLRCCGEADGFLESPASGLGAALVAAPEPEMRIGPYRTLGVVGRGGMGVVYLAERDDEHFRMRVAVKVLPRGMEGGQAVRRFLEERQILARLQHPGIARLLDGGVTEDGLPYFVMEYVEGTRLDRYCDARGMGLRERLALFCRVCEAVEYAHRNLVVHRDIKPANVLVTAAGEVKLLDFGIARLTEPGPGAREHTGTGRGWMTPEFASPEQVRGEPVTTESDVYALGVVLYRLLAGRSPYEPTGRTPHEVERSILEAEPPRPSDTVQSVGGTEDARRLRRRLRGDLDAIVLRAMRKEPERRYPSAEALRQDVLRHLDGRPVEARAGTRRYRAGRFVRRHRAAVGAAAVLLLTLLGGMGGTLWQARAAAREAARAERVQAFLVDIFDQSDPERVNGDSITARQLLDEGARRIDAELRGEPETQARMYLLLGGIYRRLGVEGRAEAMLDRALDLRTRLHGRDDVRTAQVLEQQGLVAVEQQRLPLAERLMREVLAIRGRHLAPDDSLVADGHAGLASALYMGGRWDDAERTIRAALGIDARARHGALRSAVHLEQLSSILRKRGQTDSAIATARRALALRGGEGGPDRLTTRTALVNLGRIYAAHGDFAAADTLFRQAIAFDRRRLGAESRTSLSDQGELASVLAQQGKLAEAERLGHALVASSSRAYPATHPFPYIARGNLAHVLASEQRFAQAEPLYREAYEGLRRAYGPDHPDAVAAEASLAATLALLGRMDEAETLFGDAVMRIRRAVGDDNPRSASAMLGYSELLLKRGKPARALPMMRTVAQVLGHALAPGHPELLRAESVLGACLSQTGSTREGGALLERTYRTLLRTRGSDDVYTDRARGRLTDHYARTGRRDLIATLAPAAKV
ncbi:MAG: hypothetical protein JWM27_2214 [Gemmatimonadetes bacterium]|nr:hypothetical protein [Gemmatimonadota bacterium]